MLFHLSPAHWLSMRWLEVHTVKKKKEVDLVRPVKASDSDFAVAVGQPLTPASL